MAGGLRNFRVKTEIGIRKKGKMMVLERLRGPEKETGIRRKGKMMLLDRLRKTETEIAMQK